MKALGLRLTAVLAATFFSGPMRAAFAPADVSADARWVVHVDFNALRASSLGAQLVATATEMQTHMNSSGITLNVPKLLETLGSATAYGTNFSKNPAALDGALLLRGTADLRKILESVLLQATIMQPEIATELKDLPFPAYAVRDPKNAADTGIVVAFPPEAILASKSRAQLLKAREIVTGKAPTLAQSSSSPLRPVLNPAANAYVFVASALPADEFGFGDAPQARILKMAHTLSVAIGETGANTFAHATLVANSDEMADKLMKILEGMMAMLSLAESTDQHLAEFLNSTGVSREENAVSLRLAYPTERLKTMFANIQRHHRAPERGQPRPTPSSGRVIAQWTAEDQGDEPSKPAVRVLENVELKNGSTISLGRRLNGGRAVRFTQVEIVPAAGGSPLIYGPETLAPRGDMAQVRFPGVDGSYTLKVSYVNDGSGKASYAVSVRDPRPRAPSPEEKKP